MSEGIEQIVPPSGNVMKIYAWSEMARTCDRLGDGMCQWCVRQYVRLVTYSGEPKSFWGIGSKESRNGQSGSNPLGWFPKCGNKLSVDAHSLASFASCLLTSQNLFFNSSVKELGLMAHKAAGKNCVLIMFNCSVLVSGWTRISSQGGRYPWGLPG